MVLREFIDGIFQGSICTFCGCTKEQHDRRVRRTSGGSKVYLHCLNCPARMGTRQVVCIAEPGVYR